MFMQADFLHSQEMQQDILWFYHFYKASLNVPAAFRRLTAKSQLKNAKNELVLGGSL